MSMPVHKKSNFQDATAETMLDWKIKPLQKMVHVPDFVRCVSDFARFTLSCADFKRFSCSGKQFLKVEYFIKLVVIFPWKSTLTTHFL